MQQRNGVRAMLAILTAVKWVQDNWKLVAIAAILGGAFYSGWTIRGHIAESAQNKAIAAAVQETKDKERAEYEKATQLEKRKRADREKARIANASIYATGSDACSDMPVNPEWVQLLRDAIGDWASK